MAALEQIIKGVVHLKKKNSVIIYSLSSCFKPLFISFLCWTQWKILWRMSVIRLLMDPNWLTL